MNKSRESQYAKQNRSFSASYQKMLTGVSAYHPPSALSSELLQWCNTHCLRVKEALDEWVCASEDEAVRVEVKAFGKNLMKLK